MKLIKYIVFTLLITPTCVDISLASESENSQVTWDTIRAFNFEKVKEGKKVPKVADESKWKGGKVDIKVIPDSKDSNNKILELNVKKFGQLRFGNFSLPEKRDYRAIIDLWGQEGQEVVVQLRFLTKPYKVLAKEKVSLTNEPQQVVLNLPDFYIDRKVALFLITKQSSKIYVDNVAIQARALTKQELEEKQKIEALRKERKEKNQVIANEKMKKAWEAGNIAFPDDANLVNVVTYGAKGDGVTDDTAAIQDALNNNAASHKIIYFPNGEYLISDTLKWTRRTKGKDYKTTIFQGESREGVVLKLKNKTEGYQDPEKPKAMVWTGNKPAQRFRNAVRDMTFDIGDDNPGAAALQFNASNQGTVSNVRLRSVGNVPGKYGLDMRFTDEVGPLLVQDLEVEGFQIGIACGFFVNSQTFERVKLHGQKIAGISNKGQSLSFRHINSSNTVPAVINEGKTGIVLVIDSELTSPEKTDVPAIINSGNMVLRNIKTENYALSLQEKNNEKDDIEEDYIKEYVAGGRFSTGDGEAAFLNLPIEETPKVPWGNREDWISPTKFGAIKDDKISDSDAIQKAIDSGKKTVYLPNGTYRISKPIIVRGSVERIIGCEAQLFVDKSMHGSKKPVFRIEDGPGTPIIFERFNGMPFEDREFHWFEHASPRTVIFKNLNLFTSQVYKNTVPGGKIFIEDVASQTKGGGFWDLKGQTLFARQFNTERGGEGTINILNDGGSVWILGLKTERDGTIVKTLNNGKTEILGGHFYGLRYPKKDPMFIIEDSNFAVSAAETVFNWGTPYEEIVKVSDAGKTKLYKKSDFPEHLKGVVITLFSTKEK